MLEHLDPGRFDGQRVGVVYGGRGAERPISLETGRALAEALRQAGHDVAEYDLPGDLARLVEERPAAVLLGLHGDGEDGTAQGFFELLQIPYTGSGVLASALAMDKARAKDVMAAAGVPLANGLTLTPDVLNPAALAPLLAAEEWTEHGVVIKANDSGSSHGVFVLAPGASLEAPLIELAEMLSQGLATGALVEERLRGPEFSVGFFDDVCLGCIRITPAAEFYDFHAKYEANTTRYDVVEDDDLAARLEAIARQAWQALGCRGVGRVDVMAAEEQPLDDLRVLEVNTIPGMTATSLVPKLAARRGIDFARFASLMLAGATTDAASRSGD